LNNVPPSRADLPINLRRRQARRRNRAPLAAKAEAETPMMTARPDATQSLEERVGALEALVAQLVGQLVGQPDEDGPARARGKWLRTKAAAAATGYSVSGLKKLCREGRCVYDDDAPRRLINIDSVPRKCPK
jgi:hypothetical protein